VFYSSEMSYFHDNVAYPCMGRGTVAARMLQFILLRLATVYQAYVSAPGGGCSRYHLTVQSVMYVGCMGPPERLLRRLHRVPQSVCL